MKFSDIKRGARARRRISFALSSGEVCECDVRVLLAGEVEGVLARATESAKKHGGEPVLGHESYDLAKAIEHVAACCLDPLETEREVKFFAGATEVRDGLDAERILYIYEQQRSLQRATAPLLQELGDKDYVESLKEAMEPAKEGDEGPFAERWKSWAPSLQRNWCRTTAGLLFSSQITRSLPGSVSLSATPSDTSASSTP